MSKRKLDQSYRAIYDGSEVNSDLGYLLGTTRMELKMTLSETARRLGMPFQNLWRIEHGRINLPKKYVKPISELLGLNIEVIRSLVLQNSHVFKQLKKLA